MNIEGKYILEVYYHNLLEILAINQIRKEMISRYIEKIVSSQ